MNCHFVDRKWMILFIGIIENNMVLLQSDGFTGVRRRFATSTNVIPLSRTLLGSVFIPVLVKRADCYR